VFVPLAHVGGGVFEPLQLLPPLVALGAYAVRARTLARQGRPVPLWRSVCFAAGILLILAALVSPAAHIGTELILAHMAQHVLMADLAALLLVLGLTGPLMQPLLATRVAHRLRILAHPVVAFSLWAINLYVWHLPFLYQAALQTEAVHALQHGTFIFFGFTMWLALLGPLPQPEWFGNGARLIYIVGVRFAGAILGNVFLWSESVFYPDYRPGQASWDLEPLQDQAAAGTIMMVESSIVTVLLLGWLFVKTARESEEKQALLELASARGLDLSERRAARAVASGRGDELRRRLERAAAGLGAVVLLTLVLAGCDLSSSDEAERVRPLPPPKQSGAAYEERVIRGWLLALQRDDFDGAAYYFAPHALIDQGRPYHLGRAFDARSFNASLPCRADLVDVEDEPGPRMLASFRLREGPGGPCSGIVKVRFTIRKGKFTVWRQLPEESDRPPADSVEPA
jgi:putative membrane protein